ncbi:hypothetical protein P7K49_015009, partial [Saguinus oedipus]
CSDTAPRPHARPWRGIQISPWARAGLPREGAPWAFPRLSPSLVNGPARAPHFPQRARRSVGLRLRNPTPGAPHGPQPRSARLESPTGMRDTPGTLLCPRSTPPDASAHEASAGRATSSPAQALGCAASPWTRRGGLALSPAAAARTHVAKEVAVRRPGLHAARRRPRRDSGRRDLGLNPRGRWAEPVCAGLCVGSRRPRREL